MRKLAPDAINDQPRINFLFGCDRKKCVKDFTKRKIVVAEEILIKIKVKLTVLRFGECLTFLEIYFSKLVLSHYKVMQ